MQDVGLLSVQSRTGDVRFGFRVDSNIGRIRAQTHHGNHRPVIVGRAKVTDGVAVIGPLAQLLRVVLRLLLQLCAKVQEHELPAQSAAQAENAFVKFFSRADVDRRKPFQQSRILCRRWVRLHQRVRLVEEFFRRHRDDLFQRNKIVARVVGSLWGRIIFHPVCRERHQLHLVLKGVDIRQVFLAGYHHTGDGPDHRRRHIDALNPLREFALPAVECDGVGSRLFQHSSGICPCVQHLNVIEPVGFRHDINHRLFADVQPCLRIQGVYVGRNDRMEAGVHRLFAVAELIDRRVAVSGCLRIGRGRFGRVHDDKREGVEVGFF